MEYIAKLPCGFTATFRWDNGYMKTLWEPDVPRHFNSQRQHRKFFKAYRYARREFLTDVATTIGGGVLIMDTDGTVETVVPRGSNNKKTT